MEDKTFLTEEEKHQKAYTELKEIQRKYGFENIAQLREFYRHLSQIFLDYDRLKESMRGEEFEPLFKEIFKFVADVDEMEDSQIEKSYKDLEELLIKEKLSPKITSFVKSVYLSRAESEIEKSRRKIIREQVGIEKTMKEYYVKEYERHYEKALRSAFNLAFNFPNYHTDWTKLGLHKIVSGYKYTFDHVTGLMREANIPEQIIQEFNNRLRLIPEYLHKIEIAKKRKGISMPYNNNLPNET